MAAQIGILFDLDGVIYQAGMLIPGADQVIGWCQAQRIPHLFLTNTTSKPRQAIVDKLAVMGIQVTAEQILTPALAATRWLSQQGFRVELFVPEATRAEFAAVKSGDNSMPVAVVVGDLGNGWDFATLNRAFRLLISDHNSQLVALGLTRYWRADDGLRLDTGPFVKALEYATGHKARLFGKPAPDFFAAGCQLIGVEPGACVMVGDDIQSDVGAAQQAGLTGILVRTGKFSQKELHGEVTPQAVLDSVADLPGYLRQARYAVGPSIQGS